MNRTGLAYGVLPVITMKFFEFKYPRVLLGCLICLTLFVFFLILDGLFPIDLVPRTRARVILAQDHTPLRCFADENGIWRYPVTMDQVSEKYIEALLGYEDRWFYYHPGINLLSMVRAAFQWIQNGRVISGGSTLTMQVARLRRPVPRTITGKVLQMLVALQLEWHFTKDEILTYYINHAPFGGTFQGVQAACFAYFDHSARDLTHAQAALLAVMPQAPSRYRPDRHAQAARKARNKLLARLLTFGIWSREQVAEAMQESVMGWSVEARINAPLLARRLHGEMPRSQTRVATFINSQTQEAMEELARDYASGLPPHVSLAILAMNNFSGAVEAYVGSADFFNLQRAGHVDMVRALRSPGSTLKPFIYAMALDQGLIHSQSLLMDVPILFGDYQPVNFHRSFSGPVSAAKALSLSLNLPAVQLLDHLGPRFFYSGMVNAGFKIKLPRGAKPNLSMALGGLATNLESLVRAYSSLGRGGNSIKPRFLCDSKTVEHDLFSSGAAWIVQRMLLPSRDGKLGNRGGTYGIKTGTSYGFRDAWALGVDRGYTLGVWVGRPDGLPVPGYYGALAATPLLRSAFQLLPRHQALVPRPGSVSPAKICWPGGQLASFNHATKQYDCQKPRNSWLLDHTAPKTLTSQKGNLGPAVKELDLILTADGGYRIPGGCDLEGSGMKKRIRLWPIELESWLPPCRRRAALIPRIHPRCSQTNQVLRNEPVKIMGLHNGNKIVRKDKTSQYPVFTLKARGGTGPWYWFENSVMAEQGAEFRFTPRHAGDYQLLVVDQSGAMDKIEVIVF